MKAFGKETIFLILGKKTLPRAGGCGKREVTMVIYVLAALLAALALLPSWMKRAIKRSQKLDSKAQVVLLMCFHICLGLSVFLTFFITWFTFWVNRDFVSPWLVGVDPTSYIWDQELTGRRGAYLLLVFAVPWVVFTRVCLLAVRDVHQLCKEQLDRVRKTHALNFLWKGV